MEQKVIVQFFERVGKTLARLHPVGVYLSKGRGQYWLNALDNMIKFKNTSALASQCAARYAACCHEFDENDGEGIEVAVAANSEELHYSLKSQDAEDVARWLRLDVDTPTTLVIVPALVEPKIVLRITNTELRITNANRLTATFEPVESMRKDPVSCSWAELAHMIENLDKLGLTAVLHLLTDLTLEELRAMRVRAHEQLYPHAIPVGSW